MKSRLRRIGPKLCVWMAAAILMAGCNTRYLPEGEYLYTGGKVKVERKRISKKEANSLVSDLENLTRPRPNRSTLGMKFRLYFYNIAGVPKKEKGLRYWLRNKVGEPPVLFSDVDLDKNAKILANRLENRGYFHAVVTPDSTRSGKRITAIYTATPGTVYRLNTVTFNKDTSILGQAVAATEPETFLKSGDAYSLDRIKAERERIDKNLKEKGYYYFGPDYLIMRIDSTVGGEKVNIYVSVKPKTPEKAKEVYRIGNIYIFPDYSLQDSTSYDSSAVKYKRFTVMDPNKKFKIGIFRRSIHFRKGDVYNRTNHNQSLSRLIDLGTFKFVKTTFTDNDTATVPMLDVHYYLTPMSQQSMRIELLGKTNSANYTGSELNVSWLHRNIFRGAELLNISVFGGAEVQISGQNRGYNLFRVGSEVSLTWPKFLSPFRIPSYSAFTPRTKLSFGYEFQNRLRLYSLNTFNAAFTYIWKQSMRKEHEFSPLSISYVNAANVTEQYMDSVALDPTLQKVIQRQLILGPTYSFTYSTASEPRVNTFYYKVTLGTAGTIPGLILKADAKKGEVKKLVGVEFSQYARMEHDFRHYLRLAANARLVSRIDIGVGMPYGNSTALPFIKQFFSGGANSIRAFRARSVGPGLYHPEVTDSKSFLPDQSGDMKLEMNMEYRAKIFSVIHGAVFVDAGNIWLMNRDPLKPGAEFSPQFFKQLAVGTGIGLRLDLSFLILRGDLAFPIRKPWFADGDRWVFDRISFGNGSWRKENLVFNLAIGYPF